MRMIRWSSFLVLSAAIGLVAMTAPAGAAVFGFKGGLSVATLRGSLPTDGLVENSSKLGFGVGGWLAIPLGPNLSLQPELNYVQKGTSLGTVELTDPGGTVIGSVDVLEAVGYLELPMLLRLSFPAGGPVSPYLVGGPVVGFRLSQQLRVSGTINASTGTDVFRSTDLGAALGGGFELGRGPFRGTFETRYTLGLTAATEDFYSSDTRNGALLVITGVVFRR